MSYEPTIIIAKEDLEQSINAIWKLQSAKKPKNFKTERWDERLKALTDIEKFSYYEGVKIRGITIIILHVGETAYNAAVRNILRELNIEFAVEY